MSAMNIKQNGIDTSTQPTGLQEEEVLVSTSLPCQLNQSSSLKPNNSYPPGTPVAGSRQHVPPFKQPSYNISIAKQRISKMQPKALNLLVRVLCQYLERADPEMLCVAKVVLKHCERSHKIKDSKYNTLADAINHRLRDTVGEAHWKKAIRIQKRLVVNRRKRKTLVFGLAGLGQQCSL